MLNGRLESRRFPKPSCSSFAVLVGICFMGSALLFCSMSAHIEQPAPTTTMRPPAPDAALLQEVKELRKDIQSLRDTHSRDINLIRSALEHRKSGVSPAPAPVPITVEHTPIVRTTYDGETILGVSPNNAIKVPRTPAGECPAWTSKHQADLRNMEIFWNRKRSTCPGNGTPNAIEYDSATTNQEESPESQAWVDHAISVFGEEMNLTSLQREVFRVLHPLTSTNDTHQDQEQPSSRPRRWDFTINWKDRFSQNSDDDICPFSKDEAPMPPADSRFAQDGYSLVKFLYKRMFQEHGWVTVPLAGTGLGTYRHHGMYEHDDDMDMLIYPPLKYLLPPTLKERERWNTAPKRAGVTLMEQTAYFEDVKRKYGNQTGPNVTAEKRPAEYHEYINVLKRDYSWPLSNLDTWRWIYDDFHEQFLEYQREIPVADFQWAFKETSFLARPMFANLHMNTTFYDYHKNVGNDSLRSCGFRYDSTNRTELRRMFFPGRPCLPNHYHVCLQPTPYLYETSKHGPASLYTLWGQKGAGNLCKCRFGPKDSDSHFMMCPSNMLQFVSGWYGKKWCVAIGPVHFNPSEKSWGD